jgi:hypothetical protein
VVVVSMMSPEGAVARVKKMLLVLWPTTMRGRCG